MPQISRLRQSSSADISPLSKLTRLQQLNLVGFGLADVTPLSSLGQLSRLEAGLNPLSGDSLRVLGWLPALAHLELGGISQVGFWVHPVCLNLFDLSDSTLIYSSCYRAQDSCELVHEAATLMEQQQVGGGATWKCMRGGCAAESSVCRELP